MNLSMLMKNWKMISLSNKDISQQKSSGLVSALEHTVRSEKNMARDEFRHPYETLTFFGISPAMKVIELSPGGGWYTEIFASYLEQGNLIAAHHDPNSKSNYRKRSRARFEEKLNSNPIYDSIKLVNLNGSLAEPSSVDAVVTFRNLHNWIGSSVDSIFKNSFTALKSGGILGVVEHRAPSGTSVDSMKKVDMSLKIMQSKLHKMQDLSCWGNQKLILILKILLIILRASGRCHQT